MFSSEPFTVLGSLKRVTLILLPWHPVEGEREIERDRKAYWQTDRQAQRQTQTETDRGRQTGRQADRDRQADRQRERGGAGGLSPSRSKRT